MAELIWTERALSDLSETAEYLAPENPQAARAVVQRVFSAVERLEQHSASGKVPAELENSRYRAVISGPCRVFYRHSRGQVFILYVMRCERELRDFILEHCNDRGK